jgi:methyl-accepting chemotaxis protein/Ca2+-binding EF-hand superfamily protein
MAKHSRKGFRKLESHELSEFSTLKGEESGSDTEMIEEMEGESVSRRGGGTCCWCVALYVILLTCAVVLMAMTGVYFGYNMLRISSDYRQRIGRLESRVDELEKSISDAKTSSKSDMDQMKQRLGGVNSSLLQVTSDLSSHSKEVHGKLGAVEGDVADLKQRMGAFESHPPTIGEDEVNEMRNNMAEFRSHIESYDAQLAEVKRLTGDTTSQATKVDERVQLFERNLTSLRGGLERLQQGHRETDSNLDLLTVQFSALQTVVQGINRTLLQEVNGTRDSVDETEAELREVEGKLSVLSDQLHVLFGSVEHLDSSLGRLAASVDHLNVTVDELATADVTAAVEIAKSATLEPPTDSPTTQPTTTNTPPPLPTTTQPPVTTEAQATTEATVEATTATSQPSEPETVSPDTDIVAPSPVPTTNIGSSIKSSSSSPADGSVNPPTNDEELDQFTPLSPIPSPDGTQPGTDSTEATEDIPGSQSARNSSSTSSEQGPPSDSGQEYQPPTVEEQDRTLEDTIAKLNELLMQLPMLDSNGDGFLDYSEFAVFAGDTLATQKVFTAIDLNRDMVITGQEIMDTIQVVETQATGGTEDVPSSTEDESTDVYTDDRFPGTQTEPALTEPTAPPGSSEYGDESSPYDDVPSVPVPETTSTDATEADRVGPGTISVPTNGDVTGDSVGVASDDKIEKEKGVLQILIGIQKSFATLDINADGLLDIYEFRLYFPRESDIVSSIFNSLDADADSFVTSDEIMDAISLLEDQLSTEEGETPDNFFPEDETEKSREEELANYLHGENTNF